MSLFLRTRQASEMLLLSGFPEDTSLKSTRSRRNRTHYRRCEGRSSAAHGMTRKRQMRTVVIWTVISFVSSLLSQGQSIPIDESPAPARTYHLLREDDDWSFLADRAERQELWDPIKYIPLRSGRNDWFLSMGGEARETWEQIGNDNWGQQPFMNGYFNQRYMLDFDVHYGEHVRSFVELKSELNSYRIGGPRPIDEKKLDFQTAFLEVGTGDERNWIKFRAGRHEMEYGSGPPLHWRGGRK